MNRVDLIKALRSMDKPDMAYGYDGPYKWNSEKIARDAVNEIKRLEAELAGYREAERSCEYKIHTPADEGYPDVPGRFYSCSCGANYIDIAQAQEWRCCPHCGKSITSFETLTCISCKSAEWDGDSYYCKAENGMYRGEEVTHANFDGCKHYTPREEATALARKKYGPCDGCKYDDAKYGFDNPCSCPVPCVNHDQYEATLQNNPEPERSATDE